METAAGRLADAIAVQGAAARHRCNSSRGIP